MEEERITEHNENIIEKKFGSMNGMGATYINTRKVPNGFQLLCEGTPHHAWDHIVYGRRDDGQYIGIGQPYPMCADDLCEVNRYCQQVGLEMTLTGGSTWNVDCMRILFQRDEKKKERFDIAVNCSRWHDDYPCTGDTKKIVSGVNRRFARQADPS